MNMTDRTSDLVPHSLGGATNRQALAVFDSNFRSGRIFSAKHSTVDNPRFTLKAALSE